jgi:hypothetical protein
VLLPFTLFAVGRQWPVWPWPLLKLTLALCVLAVLVAASWTRAWLDQAQAHWQATESVYSRGVAAREIAGSPAWNGYRGAFDEWLESVRGQQATGLDHYNDWRNERRRRATYSFVYSTAPPNEPRSEVIGAIAYRDVILRQRYVYILQRVN